MVDLGAETRPIVIKPPGRWPGFGLGELWRTRRVLSVLALRDFKARYHELVLGVLWVVLEPLAITALMAILMTWLLGRDDRYSLPFPVFLLTGWAAFRVFSRVANQGAASIRSNGQLVERVYLPRAFFPLSIALVSLVDLAALIGTLLIVLAVYGIAPGVGLLALPLLLLIMYAFALGIAFLSSAAAMGIPDIEIVRQLVLRAWFWVTPIMYPISVVPEQLRPFYYLNPMAVVVEGFRWAFTQTPMPPLGAWLLGSASAGLMLVAGYMYFRRREPYFADLL
jgi:lipopolysaccharide transport system permease protein